MEVAFHPDAEVELRALSARERVAVMAAVEKLVGLGTKLGYPHTSQVKGERSIRELRPRSGRSQVRLFYRRIGNRLVVGSIGPEATVDPNGFRKAISTAVGRLNQIGGKRET